MRRVEILALLSLVTGGITFGVSSAPPARRPGTEPHGVTLLPNGWKIAPAGRHLTVGDLPLSIAESPDGRALIISNGGWAKPTLVVVDSARWIVRDRLELDQAWLGLAFHPDGKRLYSSGAGGGTVQELRFEAGKLKPSRSLRLPKAETPGAFVGGVCVRPDGKRVYAVHVLGERLTALDASSGEISGTRRLPAEAYTCITSPDGRTLFVSLWGGAKVLLFDAETLDEAGEIAVGEHPNAMTLSKDGARLFVACANTNAVWAIDLALRRSSEQISVSLFPSAPAGSTPNALALSADGGRLLVANADNNTVAVINVETPGQSRVLGFIPTGWYPTAVSFSRDGRNLFVLSGKGLASGPNPRGPQPGVAAAPGQMTRSMLWGSLSAIPVPDSATLARYTKTVYALTPLSARTVLAPSQAPDDSPIPARVGRPSPIQYVFYIIRENRTYDQILGDVASGNGDPNLCLFGEDVTPNAHALTREFVLFDNFYTDAEVSYDGHAFSTGAYATDFVEKVWPMNYADRGGDYLSEGGGVMRTPYGNVAAPAQGYIWDACVRKGLSVRSYGEFALSANEIAEDGSGEPPYEASVPGLVGRVCPDYPPWDLSIPDMRRVDVWLKEFREFEKSGNLPRLSILRLPGDHTNGTKPKYPTPRAMIAENDLALGRIVEAVSRSRYWKQAAIFVLEDDAQNGPDHVDAHRSVLLVASPFTRRGLVDSTLYTTCGVLRTIELALGLPPMSQYDAAATPLYKAFSSALDPRPFACREARVPLDEQNAPQDWGAQASEAMDFSGPDRAPEHELNEILWKSVRGAGSTMPPPVHAAFVRPVEKERADD